MLELPALASCGTCDESSIAGWSTGLPPWPTFVSGSVIFFGVGNDVDVVALVADLDDAAAVAVDAGYTVTTGAYDTDGRRSLRRGVHNLILCTYDDYRRMLLAHATCVQLIEYGLLSSDKAHRVAIFRAVFNQGPA